MIQGAEDRCDKPSASENQERFFTGGYRRVLLDGIPSDSGAMNLGDHCAYGRYSAGKGRALDQGINAGVACRSPLGTEESWQALRRSVGRHARWRGVQVLASARTVGVLRTLARLILRERSQKARGGELDGRGVSISREPLLRILDALPRTSDGRPRFPGTNFEGATFEQNAAFGDA
jgi:hypothetical protein